MTTQQNQNSMPMPYIKDWTTDYTSGAWGSGTLSEYAPHITDDGRIVWKNADRSTRLPGAYEIPNPEKSHRAMHYYPISDGVLTEEQTEYLRQQLSERLQAKRDECNAKRRQERADKPLKSYYAEWLKAVEENGVKMGRRSHDVCWEQYGLPAFEQKIPADISGKYAAIRYKAHSLRRQLFELSSDPPFQGLPGMIAACDAYDKEAASIKSQIINHKGG